MWWVATEAYTACRHHTVCAQHSSVYIVYSVSYPVDYLLGVFGHVRSILLLLAHCVHGVGGVGINGE